MFGCPAWGRLAYAEGSWLWAPPAPFCGRLYVAGYFSGRAYINLANTIPARVEKKVAIMAGPKMAAGLAEPYWLRYGCVKLRLKLLYYFVNVSSIISFMFHFISILWLLDTSIC